MKRSMSRKMARELSADELKMISGGWGSKAFDYTYEYTDCGSYGVDGVYYPNMDDAVVADMWA